MARSEHKISQYALIKKFCQQCEMREGCVSKAYWCPPYKAFKVILQNFEALVGEWEDYEN